MNIIFQENCYFQVKSKKKEVLKTIYNSFRLHVKKRLLSSIIFLKEKKKKCHKVSILFLFVIKKSYDHILTKKYLEVEIRSLRKKWE